MQGEIHVSVHLCMKDYFEVHMVLEVHVIRYRKKRVPRFLIFEALLLCNNIYINIINNFSMFT